MAAKNQNHETEPSTTEVEATQDDASTVTTLVSPDGKREWDPADATEAVNLRTRGWKPKASEKSATPKSEK